MSLVFIFAFRSPAVDLGLSRETAFVAQENSLLTVLDKLHTEI